MKIRIIKDHHDLSLVLKNRGKDQDGKLKVMNKRVE